MRRERHGRLGVIIELAMAIGAAGVAAWAYRRQQAKHAAAAGPHKQDDKQDDKHNKPDEPPPRARRRGLNISDVILYADTELWLAGCIELDDGGTALLLFATPGGKRASFVAQLDREGEDLATLDYAKDIPAGRVPDELPVEGVRLRLRKRGSAEVITAGESLPLTTERAEFVVLGGPGGRLLIVVDFVGGERLALHGERVPRGMMDLLPGG